MKVEIIKGTVNNGKETFTVGKTLDMDDKEAENLIALGFVKKSGTDKKDEPSPETGGASGASSKAGDDKK